MRWGKIIGSMAVLLSGALLFGCGGKKAEADPGASQEGAEEYVYLSEFREVGSEEDVVAGAYLGKESLYYALVNAKKEGAEPGFAFYELPVEQGEPKQLYQESSEYTPQTIGETKDGFILALTNGEEKPQQQLLYLSRDGKETGRADITEYFMDKEDTYISGIQTDSKGNSYLLCGNFVLCVDAQGKSMAEISAGAYISSLVKLQDDRMVAGYFSDTGWRMEVVDISNQKLMPLDSKITFDYGSYQRGAGKDFLYTQESKLYTCDIKDGEPVMILDWVDSDVDSNMLVQYNIQEDGRIVAYTMDYQGNKAIAELAVLKKIKKTEAPQKTILTYGTYHLPYYTNKDIVAFNKQSKDYRIEVKDYSDGDTDLGTAITNMNTDIASNKAPDMYDLQYGRYFLDAMAEQGVMEDLNPYFEKDPELKKEDFLPNAMKMYEIDGRMTGVLTNFRLDSLAGKKSVIGDRTSWTMEDMAAVLDAQDAGMDLLPYVTKDYMLNILCQMDLDQFIDAATGKCDFTKDSFRQMLEFANRFPVEAEYRTAEEGNLQRIKNGELLLDISSLSSVQMYQMYEAGIGGPVTFVGYPTEKKSGTILQANGTSVGMYANSENKDGVWEFIRFLLSKERQDINVSANGGFPVRESSLEERFASDMEKEYDIDADGNQIEIPKGIFGNGEVSVEIFAATQEQVDRVRELILNTEVGQSFDSQIYQIISEEVQTYFNNQKKIEDVVPLIQNRVQTYLNENG